MKLLREMMFNLHTLMHEEPGYF